MAKMATPTLARLKGHRNWERKSLFPSVGAVSRKAHKHSHVDPKTEKLLCQLTWASIDFAQHCIAAPGRPELQNLVADPEAFRSAMHQLPIIAFDQTPVWLKLRGEERICVSQADVIAAQTRRTLATRLARQDLSVPDRELTAAQMQDWRNQHPVLELESHQRVSQGETSTG